MMIIGGQICFKIYQSFMINKQEPAITPFYARNKLHRLHRVHWSTCGALSPSPKA